MLLTLFAILVVALAAVLWVGSIFLQGWLYSDLARHLPLRAVGGAVVLAGFHTAWCWSYQGDPGRFDTLQNFSREKLDGSYDEFQSVRKVGNDEKKPAKFERKKGGRGTTDDFQAADTKKPWARSDAEGMVAAVLVQEPNKTEPTRFNAELQPDGKFPATGLRYIEDKGKRYMDEAAIGKVYRVRPAAILMNLLANGFHLLLWIVVIWIGMRFTVGNAVAIGLVAWGLVMVVVQPVLFGLVTK